MSLHEHLIIAVDGQMKASIGGNFSPWQQLAAGFPWEKK
jgi:hypothetical protein